MIEHRSQVYRRTLLCDHPRCRVRIHLEGETLKAAYDDAQGQGWRFVTEATDKVEMAMRREYCPEHAAALGDALELLQHGLFHEVGQLLDQEAALIRVLALRHAPFAVDDELDRQRAAH